MRNPTPRQIVIRTTLLVCLVIIVFEGIAYIFPIINTFWYHVFFIPIAAMVVGYFVFYSVVETFIYRKIKLVYKNIHDLKSTKEIVDLRIDMKKDILGIVDAEVEEWAKNRSYEIEHLKQLETYRKEFLGNVSHELKTPITSILGYLETLVDGGIEDPDINREYILKAMRNVERLIYIIDDLESISHLESGELILNCTIFDINELAKDVMENLEMQAAQSKIILKIKEGCDHSFMVFADKKLIREVLVNLISNSLKYGKEFGQTQVGYYRMGQNVLIEIADNGVGIAKEHLGRVFERFYRIEKSRSRNFGGTGLGLSIVKHVIEAHHQTITVRSTIGQGSTFGFTLQVGK